MFKLVKLKDVVRIPPAKFNEPLEKVAFEILRSKYEGAFIPGVGYVVGVINTKVSEYGIIVPRDPAVHHIAEFEALVYEPILNEVVEGEVVVVEDIGLFVRIGPVDGFIHKSQISGEQFSYDRRHSRFMSEKGKKIIGKGDIVRARIVSISTSLSGTRGVKIGLTMRQPFLGKLEWIEEEIKRLELRK